ncbi:MAG: ABC transporter family substrate-binding protein [Actinobacteria bacterium]|nr:ABC transporter family substrate-binding protein [Actinomycetota bacterium]
MAHPPVMCIQHKGGAMKQFRTRGVVAVFATAALLISACGGNSDSDSATDATGATDEATDESSVDTSTIVYASEQEYATYNNGTADQGLFATTLVLNQVLPSAFFFNPDFSNFVWDPVVKSAEVTSQDPFTVTYVLNPDAIWSDGEAIDCDDFYLAWRASNGKDGSRKDDTGADVTDADGNTVAVWNTGSTTGYELIDSTTCSEDGKTITTVYSKIFADWKVLFGGLLPAHIVERESGVADLTAELSNADLYKVADYWNTGFVGFKAETHVSGGPYMITDFTPGQSLTLSRNPKWMGEPALTEKIVFLMVPDATAQPAALQNGEVDVITPQPNVDLVAQINAISGVGLQFNAGTTWEHFDFNLKNEHLKSVKVRQAIAACIDREEIVNTLYRSVDPSAQVLNNRMFMPNSPYFVDGSGKFATRDIDLAKSLLEEDGYVLGADGYYAKGGKTLSLRLGRRDPNPRRQQTNELVIAQCKEAGIQMTDDPAEDFFPRLFAGETDIALFAWVASPALSSINSSYLPPDQGGGNNWNNYVNTEVVGITDAADSELDEAKRAALYNQLDGIIWRDMVTVPLVQWTDLYANAASVTGVLPHGSAGVTWNADKWAKK